MSLPSSLRSIVSRLFHRARVENDTEEELRAHVQNRADDLERSGLARAEAQRRARIDLAITKSSKKNAAKNAAASGSKQSGPTYASEHACCASLPVSRRWQS